MTLGLEENSRFFCSSLGLSGKGTAKRLLPGANQKYIGRGPTECSPCGVVLQRDGDQGGDREQISWGVHQVGRGGGDLAGQESSGMGGVCGEPRGGFPQAPAVHLFRMSEVTPAGVDILSAGHLGHRRRLQPGKEGTAGDFLVSAI